MPDDKAVTVQSLEIKNFLGIKELSFSPDGKFNFITGRNGAGKTSVLRAIQYAFEGKERGKKELDYIHNGEDKAEILIDMGQFQINRRITEKGSYVDVSRDGMKYEKASTILKEMVGRFSFNPIEFAFCDEKERNEVVLGALGVKYSPKDAIKDGVYTEEELKNDNEHNNLDGLALVESLYDRYYRERTEVNRGLESAKKTLAELEEKLPENFKPFDKEAYDKLRDAIENQREAVKIGRDDQRLFEDDLETVKNGMQRLSEILTKYGDGEVHTKYEIIEKRIEGVKKEIETAQETLEKLQAQEVAQREAMEFAQVQAQIDEYKERIPKGQTKHDDLEEKIKKLRGEIKENLIASADIGIDGLAFEDGRFTVNSVPVENLSDSEKLRVGVKIAEKVAGKLDFIFIDGVERLDPETTKEFVARLESSKFQYFFTTCHPAPEGINAIKVEKPQTVVQNTVLEDVEKNEDGEIVDAKLVAVTTKK